MPTLTNWNNQIRFDVADGQFHTPTDILQVQAIVRDAYAQNQKVTVIGALHSTTECMVGRGIVISLKNMAQVLAIDVEKEQVTVQGGATLRELCAALRIKGFQPPVVLEFGNFQIGAISGTHANDTSVSRFAQFSSFVLGMKLVTPTGELLEISESQRPELLPFLRSHFGLFGVVCEVTLRIFKNQPLRITTKSSNVEHFLDHFEEEVRTLKTTQDQVFGMLFPHTGKLLWECRKFVEPEPLHLLNPGTWDDPLQRQGIHLFKDVLFPLVKAGAGLGSSALAELLSRAVIELPLGVFRQGSYLINPCDRGIVYAEHDPDFDFYDWMFPEHTWRDMVRAFLALSDRFGREQDFVLPLPTLIYFVPRDQSSLLSRARHADMMAVDPTYPDPTDENWAAFRLEFNAIARQHEGSPHINKTRGGAIHHFAQTHDPDLLKTYLQQRKAFDPNDMFLNDFFKTMFGEYL